MCSRLSSTAGRRTCERPCSLCPNVLRCLNSLSDGSGVPRARPLTSWARTVSPHFRREAWHRAIRGGRGNRFLPKSEVEFVVRCVGEVWCVRLAEVVLRAPSAVCRSSQADHCVPLISKLSSYDIPDGQLGLARLVAASGALIVAGTLSRSAADAAGTTRRVRSTVAR